MLAYYILIAVPILVALVRSKGILRVGVIENSGRKNSELIAFFGFFLLLLMFRGAECGTDTSRYLYLHEVVARTDWKSVLKSESAELAYDILSKLISMVVTGDQWLLIVTALLSVLPVMAFYKHEAELPLLTMALFVAVAPFPMYFSGLRQALAMALAIPLWYCAKQKKLIAFVLLVLLATQFHNSAFLLAAIYPLYHVSVKRKFLVFVLPVMILIYQFNGPIFNFLSQFMWDDYGSAKETGAYTVLMLLGLFAIYCFVIPDEKKMDKDMFALRNILLFSVCIQFFAPVHTLAMRMNYYFLPFVPVLIPKVVNRSKAQYRSVAELSVWIMTGFFLIYFFFKAHTGADILRIYPYIPFWK